MAAPVSIANRRLSGIANKTGGRALSLNVPTRKNDPPHKTIHLGAPPSFRRQPVRPITDCSPQDANRSTMRPEMVKRVTLRMVRKAVTCFYVLELLACGRQKAEPAQTTASVGQRAQVAALSRTTSERRVHKPAVAGSFYPDDPAELQTQVDTLLSQAKSRNLKGLRALVSPHAGYRYSGPVAATGFKQLVGLGIERVVILAPSHHVLFSGVAIPDADLLRTPLGDIELHEWSRQLAASPPFLIDSTPHRREHSLEVQLPFLQQVLNNWQVVPLVFGEVDEQVVARRVNGGIDSKTFVIASSDLSHYHPYEQASELDQATIQAVLDLNTTELSKREACGKSPILALVHLAKLRGWKPELLDYRNSGDTAGDHSRVVGYASIAFLESGG